MFTIRNPSKDIYNRTLGYVYNLKNLLVNEIMVQDGYAVAFKYQAGCELYVNLENAARSQKLGVWNDPNFILPINFKHPTM